MVARPNKPSALSATPGPQRQAAVNISHGNQRVAATLPTGESVEILLYGATVVSWKDAAGEEKLWLSEKAALDGSKAVRGGIPLVFPVCYAPYNLLYLFHSYSVSRQVTPVANSCDKQVFGPPPPNHATSSLPQHGFARTSNWEFLGKSTSESEAEGGNADLSVKLDFGLSSAGLDAETRKKWGYDFNLIYSVTLGKKSLTTSLVVTNDDERSFELQVLMHTYFRIKVCGTLY